MTAASVQLQGLWAAALGEAVDTPTGSACLPGSKPFAMVKSPLSKYDNVSATHPGSDGETSADSHGTAVDGPADEVASHAADAAALVAALAAPPPPQLLSQTEAPAAADTTVEPDSETAAGPATTSGSDGQPKPWLLGLFSTELFAACPSHPGLRKNECNQYCLGCTAGAPRAMCKYCLPGHSGSSCSGAGRVWQIRKYMYQTCVHVEDIQPLYDVSGVQAYCINSKRAVLIHPKQVSPGMACPSFDNACAGCAKPLRNDCVYCSLRCKVEVQFGMMAPLAPPTTLLGQAPARAPRQQQRSAPKAKSKPKGKQVGSATATAAALAVVALPAAAAAALAPLALPKRAAALHHALLAVRRPPSADSETQSARSSGSHESLGSRKRRKLEAPQRSFLQG